MSAEALSEPVRRNQLPTREYRTAMGIETDFDVTLVASLALKEKQIQQNYRPIIAVHKWFARCPGTLFRGLILSEFGKRPLAETFFEANNLAGRVVADPFMGGGTPLLEANRVGCDVLGFDIRPAAVGPGPEKAQSEFSSIARGLRTRGSGSGVVGRLRKTQAIIWTTPGLSGAFHSIRLRQPSVPCAVQGRACQPDTREIY